MNTLHLLIICLLDGLMTSRHTSRECTSQNCLLNLTFKIKFQFNCRGNIEDFLTEDCQELEKTNSGQLSAKIYEQVR